MWIVLYHVVFLCFNGSWVNQHFSLAGLAQTRFYCHFQRISCALKRFLKINNSISFPLKPKFLES